MTDRQVRAARLEAAAGWYAELQDENLAPDVWERFRLWERDPDNAAAFREIESTLSVLDRTKFARSPEPPKRRALFAMAGVAAAAAAVALGAFLFAGPEQATDPNPAPEVYVTAVGEQRDVSLADGSTVTLNTGTQLEVAFTDEARLVRLVEGQALFEVSPGEVPFTVEAGGRRTTALGTRFDVYLVDAALAVTLLEGSVSVDRIGEAGRSVLLPGQQLRVSGGTEVIQDVDLEAVSGWQTGMIQFRDATLAEAVAELNRYSQVKLRVDDSRLASERLSGVFTAGDQDLFLESLSLYLPVETVRAGNEILIRRRQD